MSLEYEEFKIPFNLEPIQVKLLYVETRLTKEIFLHFINMTENLLNSIITEDIVAVTENATGNTYEYHDLHISLENRQAKQILMKPNRKQNILKEKSKPTVLMSLHYVVDFDFLAPIRENPLNHGKVNEFPSLLTLKAIENKMVHSFQNESQMEQLRSQISLRYSEDLKYLESIQFDGYVRNSLQLWSNIPKSDKKIHSSMRIFRNVVFIFLGIFVFGYGVYFVSHRIIRKQRARNAADNFAEI